MVLDQNIEGNDGNEWIVNTNNTKTTNKRQKFSKLYLFALVFNNVGGLHVYCYDVIMTFTCVGAFPTLQQQVLWTFPKGQLFSQIVLHSLGKCYTVFWYFINKSF